MPSQLAPIALFVYRRPERAERLLASLSANAEAKLSDLVIYSDGAKSPEAELDVKKMRELVRGVTGFGSVTVVERERNLGLANSITDGVSALCGRHGRAIVLEEDLVVSPHFLGYMNDALARYKDEERVMQVSGHLFPLELTGDEDAVFLPLTTSWGWATWARAWRKFDGDAKGYEALKNDKALRLEFDCGGGAPYFGMLRDQLNGRVDSWAIKWYLSVFLARGLVLYPRKTMVLHEGWDEKATHAKQHGGDVPDRLDPTFSVKSFPPPHMAAENVAAVSGFFAKRSERAKVECRVARSGAALINRFKGIAAGFRRQP
ncbi:hypothetical protein AAFN88_19880 [Pelagibius sp. CAU 1746]|uniref:hypothetical protein n=1 Tax=Pelagibius sp. CAU 1746 TaxID=3140370 RepID=UPI00325B3B83